MTHDAVRSVLLLTNHLREWGGSEVIIFELGEYFTQQGADVTVFCNDITPAFRQHLDAAGLAFEADAGGLEPAGFDVIYSQHQVAALLLEKLLAARPGDLPPILFGHLSPYEAMEFPGPCIEPHFGSLAVCNSKETMAQMRLLGLDEARLLLMPNPAPDAFFASAPRPGGLRRLLAVSNHFPAEADAALDKLEASGVQVTRRGLSWTNQRITPEDVESHDAVFSIGKTVQYALAAARPIYVYDRFGGPGWISPETLDQAADFNFSGRCCHRKIAAEALFQELTGGFAKAQSDAAALQAQAERFRLSRFMTGCLQQAQEKNRARACAAPAGDALKLQLQREYHVYEQVFRFRKMAAGRNTALEPLLNAAAGSRFAGAALSLLAALGPRASRRAFRALRGTVRAHRA